MAEAMRVRRWTPAAPALNRVGAPRTVPLPAGEMQVQREGDEGQVLVRVLKLSRADLPDLGLQTGVTPVEALIRDTASPSRGTRSTSSTAVSLKSARIT